MSDLTLTATRVFQGVWEGVITRTSGTDIGAPKISVTHLGTALDDVTVTADPAQVNQWQVRVTIPAAALCDGVQTFLIRDAAVDVALGSFSIAMGDVLDTDIRGEVDLLRAELDMLKRAFRRHCVETA